LIGSATTGNVILGNWIGLKSSGIAAAGNSGAGVRIESGAHDNTIGGSAVGAGNGISGNTRHGSLIAGTGTGEKVGAGRFSGTDAGGPLRRGTAPGGIAIGAGAQSNPLGTPIGGRAPGAGNIIAFKASPGVALGGASSVIGTSIRGTRL